MIAGFLVMPITISICQTRNSCGHLARATVHGKLVYTATAVDKRACCIWVNYIQDVAGVCTGR